MTIAFIEIPHHHKAHLYIYENEAEVVEVVSKATEQTGEEYPANYKAAVTQIGRNLYAALEVRSADDIAAVELYVANRWHQYRLVETMLDELQEEFGETPTSATT